MITTFYIAGAVAIFATIGMLTRLNVVHALLYLIVSLLGVAVVFYSLGAPFIAAMEVIVYAGAIMVLFVFVVMMLNVGERVAAMERSWLSPGMWIGPGLLSIVLVAEVAYLVTHGGPPPMQRSIVDPKQVGISLFGPYLIGVELASILLLGGLVGAYHLGIKEEQHDTDRSRPAAGRDLVRAGAGRAAGET